MGNFKEGITPFELAQQLNVSWKSALHREGYVFCTCENPKHDGCSIDVRIGKPLCEYCLRGCNTRKNTLDIVDSDV